MTNGPVTKVTPKRILYCESNIDGTVGGSFYSLFYLVDGLDKTAYQPLVIFYTDNDLIPAYREAGIEVEVHEPPQPVHLNWGRPLGKLAKILQSALNFYRFFFAEAFRKAAFLRKRNIDLVHLNNSIIRSHDWMLAAKLAGKKCITHERGINNYYPAIARFFSKRINNIICISTAVKSALISGGLSDKNLVIIYNGLDPDRVQVKRQATELKNEYQLSQDAPVVGMLGNIKEWKGQEVVIKAIDIVRRKFPGVRCFLVGDISDSDSYYYERLEQLIEKASLKEHIIFTGYQSNVADFINIFDVMIHASVLPEPFGRVLVEGMALEKPLVGARGGAVPEIVVDNETGLMFEPGNHEDLAEKLIQLLEAPEKAKQMGLKGKQRLIDEFHIDRNVERTEELYRTLFK